MSRPILERDAEIALLAERVRAAGQGAGSVVLIFGEAGIGKSTLVEAVRPHVPGPGRILTGYCDDLATKRTLGPLRDLAGSVGTALTEAVQDGGDRDQVFAALRAELTGPRVPAVLVIEDVHWADEATLDVLRILVRRVASLPALLLLTYRDDEVDGAHPLHQLLGPAAGLAHVHRVPLRRLSADAVRQLTAGTRVDPDQLYAVTSGNPFFVAEVVAADDGDTVPVTVVQAVLARVAQLEGSTRQAVEQLAVIPSAVDRWLVDSLVPGGPAALVAAEERGLLAISPDRVTFRHELTRRAVADSVPAAHAIELNRRVLAALIAWEGAELSRIVHHAAGAGDRDAIVQYGPGAAREAAGAGAHREAAAHYRLVLQQRERFPPAERAELLERYAVECYTIGAAQRAVVAQQDAVELRRALGDARALGAGLRWLSRMHWWAGDRGAAEAVAGEASAVLATAGDTRLLALAYSNQSQLEMLAHRSEPAIDLGERAAALARQADDAAILSHALTNVGLARWYLGEPAGESTLLEALRVALEADETEDALRAYVGLIWSLLDDVRLREAEHYLAEAVSLAERGEHLGFLSYLHVEQARLCLARSDWDGATAAARAGANGQLPMMCPALTVQGRVGVRRGERDAEDLLRQAWDLAVEIDELQRIAPVAAARCEAAWLRGDEPEVRAVAEPVHAQARRLGVRPYEAELGYWLVKAGRSVVPAPSEHPYALQAAGRWREAASAWQAAGCPYEYAAALAESSEPDDLLAALHQLMTLGAQPLGALVRSRPRTMGVTRIPRGPYRSTRESPAGLTARQRDVLQLLGQGLTNAEIAQELVVSVRTVDNHVSALLAKIGADNRRAAVRLAADLGLLTGEKQVGPAEV